MHEGDPLISFVGKRPLPMHEGDPLIWDGLPRPRTHDDPAIGYFRSQMSSMHVGILLVPEGNRVYTPGYLKAVRVYSWVPEGSPGILLGT